MVCARFGSPSLTARVKGISVFNAMVSLLSTIFGIVGCASYTNSQDNISRAPWHVTYVKYQSNGLNAKAYVGWGIQSYVAWTQVTGGDKSFGWSGYNSAFTYSSDPVTYAEENAANIAAGAATTDTADYAKVCKKASKGVVTLCSIALIACFVAFVCHLLRACCDSTFAKDLSVLGGTTAFVLGIISYSLAVPCRDAIDAHFIQEMSTAVPPISVDQYKYGYGIGSAVVAACFGMMIWTSLVSLVIPVAEVEKTDKTAVPTAEAVETGAVDVTGVSNVSVNKF